MTPIIGHEHIQKQLARLAALPDAPQSYLLAGPRHTGKRLLALWFARKLIGGAESSGDAMLADFLVVEAETSEAGREKRERAIAVEAIRDLKRFFALAPSSRQRRVALIDGAEKLSDGAANALLKILEEPPERSVLILITAEPESLLPTLRSRLFPLQVRPVEPAKIQAVWPATPNVPAFFFDLGLPGIVAQALEYPELFVWKKEQLSLLFQLSKVSWRKRLQLAEILSKDETKAREILELFMIGLAFQARQKTGRAASERYLLIEDILATLGQFSRGGFSRGALERLLLRVA